MEYEERREVESARQRALRQLAKNHSDEFEQLFAEFKAQGLARRRGYMSHRNDPQVATAPVRKLVRDAVRSKTCSLGRLTAAARMSGTTFNQALRAPTISFWVADCIVTALGRSIDEVCPDAPSLMDETA